MYAIRSYYAAVAAGIVMASLAFVKEMAELQVESIKTVSDPDHERMFDPETTQLMRTHRERIMFLHLSGLISFGRITSYNVCYTKLLRDWARRRDGCARRWNARWPTSAAAGCCRLTTQSPAASCR